MTVLNHALLYSQLYLYNSIALASYLTIEIKWLYSDIKFIVLMHACMHVKPSCKYSCIAIYCSMHIAIVISSIELQLAMYNFIATHVVTCMHAIVIQLIPTGLNCRNQRKPQWQLDNPHRYRLDQHLHCQARSPVLHQSQFSRMLTGTRYCLPENQLLHCHTAAVHQLNATR